MFARFTQLWCWLFGHSWCIDVTGFYGQPAGRCDTHGWLHAERLLPLQCTHCSAQAPAESHGAVRDFRKMFDDLNRYGYLGQSTRDYMRLK